MTTTPEVVPTDWWFVMTHEPAMSAPCTKAGKQIGLSMNVTDGFVPMPPRLMCTLCGQEMKITYDGPTPPGNQN